VSTDQSRRATVEGGLSEPVPVVPYAFAKRFRLAVVSDHLLEESVHAAAQEQRQTSQANAHPRPLRVLITPATPPEALLEVRRFLGRAVQFNRVDESTLNHTLMALYEHQRGAAEQAVAAADESLDLTQLADATPVTEDLLEQEEDSPIIRLINAILAEALKAQASDIHLETFETRVAVRFRVDGVLRSVLEPQRALAQLLVSRLKVMARLDIAEKRLPQDGRISLRIGNREVDVRVSTIPTRHGERVVLRLLEKTASQIDLGVLGMAPADLARLQTLIAQPHGVMLVTGPTGSGKSTTLYAALSALNDGSRNILTIEDPIEYDIEGIGQTQVNAKAGMSFARGLRAILRQDPDCVMIGEIRDTETADIAIQASLTGHLVLSTLHTNTAIGAVARLIDMGVEPFLLASSLSGLIAQRLVRQLCTACKEAYTPDEATLRLLRMAPTTESIPTVYRAVGCPACYGQGYRGRTGVYEIIPVNEPLRALIHARQGEQELTACARECSSDIFADGVNKVLTGITSVDELLRVLHAH